MRLWIRRVDVRRGIMARMVLTLKRSLFNMAWAAGCMVGPLLAGLVVNSKGWPTATLILGCVSIFTALPVVIWTGGSWRKRKGRDMQAERTARMEAQA